MIEVVTHFGTLLRLAKELREAEQSRDAERIKAAKKKHDDYRELCLMADKMLITESVQ